MAGIYVANAGAMGTGAARILKQTVTVNGMVMGGMDAAVHLSGGGKLTVGKMGKVRAGSSGTAILVNDPGRSEIVINGEVRGGAGARGAVDTTGGGTITVGLTGMVIAGGATSAIHTDDGGDATAKTTVTVQHRVDNPDGTLYQEGAAAAAARVGTIRGSGAPSTVTVALNDDEGPTGGMVSRRIENGELQDNSDLPPRPPEPEAPQEETETPETPMEQPRPEPQMPKAMDCDAASDKRCRLYEALPSMLLAMNGLPTYQERMASARSEAGGWARVETARGEWEAESSTRANVAYDRSRTGVRVGADAPVGEGGRIGLSAHGLRGSAEMTQNGGKARLSGMGVGVHGTTVVGDGVYIDAQAAVTRYDVELTSAQGRTLKDGAKGTGYALAVEAGRPMALEGNLTLTPRAGLVWSRVSLGDFTDTRLNTPVSVEDAGSLLGRAGVGVEMAPADAGGLRVFGAVDVVHEFSAETEAQVMGTALEASAKSTGVRLGVGAVHGWAEGRYAVAGSASYATGGGSSGEFGGGLSLTVRF